MIADHPILGPNYSYHIRGDRSPLNNFNFYSLEVVLTHNFKWVKITQICLI